MSETQLDQICAICLQVPEPREYTILDACDHFYCVGCIREWSRIRRTCPVCKTEFCVFTTLAELEERPDQKKKKRVRQEKPSKKKHKKQKKSHFIDLTVDE